MKRLLVSTFATALLITSILLAQSDGRATLRTPSGDRPITVVERPEGSYFPLDAVIDAVGGTVTRDGAGFLVTLRSVNVAISPDSRHYVMGDELVEMPTAPISIEERPFVSRELIDAVVRRSLGLEAIWTPAARVLELRQPTVRPVAIQSSAVDLEDYTRLVMQLDAPLQFQHQRDGNYVRVTFASPLAPAVPERRFESRYVSRVAYSGGVASVELRAPDLAVDIYTLTSPFRVVMDVRPATVATPGTPGDSLQPRDLPGVRTVVIDPGHGGVEVGAIGPGGLVEKNVTLEIAQRLAAILRAEGIRVVLTRESDEQVTLEQRTTIANQYEADLFLSIHLNAAPVPGARGSETYFLSLDATDDAARMAAERENASGSPAIAGPGSNDLDFILWDLAHTESVRESSRFAEMVQDEMNRINDIRNRGVKQAPFKVLVGATMPAALVEVGFISNPDEEARLASETFQSELTRSLAAAVTRYRDDVAQRLMPALPAAQAPAAAEGER